MSGDHSSREIDAIAAAEADKKRRYEEQLAREAADKARADAEAERLRAESEDEAEDAAREASARADAISKSRTTKTPELSSNAKAEAAKGNGPKGKMVTNTQPKGMEYEKVDSGHPHSIGGQMFKALMDGWWSFSPLVGALFTKPGAVAVGFVAGVGAIPYSAVAGVLGVASGVTGLAVDKITGTDKFNGKNGYTKMFFDISKESALFGLKNIALTVPNVVTTAVGLPFDAIGLYVSSKTQDFTESRYMRLNQSSYAAKLFDASIDSAVVRTRNEDGTYSEKYKNDYAYYKAAARKQLGIGNDPLGSKIVPSTHDGRTVGAASDATATKTNPTLTSVFPDDVVELHESSTEHTQNRIIRSELPSDLSSDLVDAVRNQNEKLPDGIRKILSSKPETETPEEISPEEIVITGDRLTGAKPSIALEKTGGTINASVSVAEPSLTIHTTGLTSTDSGSRAASMNLNVVSDVISERVGFATRAYAKGRDILSTAGVRTGRGMFNARVMHASPGILLNIAEQPRTTPTLSLNVARGGEAPQAGSQQRDPNITIRKV